MSLASGKRKEPKPKLFGLDIFGWVGVFHVKEWGPKSSICPSKPGKPNIFGRISRDIPGVPEKFEKKKFVFNFRSL